MKKLTRAFMRTGWRLAAALLIALSALLPALGGPAPVANAAFEWYVGAQFPGISYVSSESCCSGYITNPSALVYNPNWGSASGTSAWISGAFYIDLGGTYDLNGFNYWFQRTDSGSVQFTLQVSTDGISYSTVVNDNYTGTTSRTPYGLETDAHGISAANTRYLIFTYYGPGVSVDLYNIAIRAEAITATPFPTPTEQCIPATSVPTATATRSGPTPTPYGATLTPPSATGTPAPDGNFTSDLATFSSSLAPWTNGPLYSAAQMTRAITETGPDGSPGVAFVKDWLFANDIVPTNTFTETGPISGSLILSRQNGLPFPIRVTGYARSRFPLAVGDAAALRIWYFDPDYVAPGQGAWVSNQQTFVNTIWSPVQLTITGTIGGSGRATAVALSESVETVVLQSGLIASGVLLDNLRLFAGPAAFNGSYPICGDDGGALPRPPAVTTQACFININRVDVIFTYCPDPSSFLDIGGWVATLWCRVFKYFEFLRENREQVQALSSRQSLNEPSGSLLELPEGFQIAANSISSASGLYTFVEYRNVEWDTLTRWAAISEPLVLDATPPRNDMDQCVLQSHGILLGSGNVAEGFYRAACVTFSAFRKTLFGPLFQWLIDILAVVALVLYIRTNWMSHNG